MQFDFFTEDGAFKMDYKDYVKREDLIRLIADDTRMFVNLGLKILSFNRQWLVEHPSQLKFVENMAEERRRNPIRFFLPHCADHEGFDTPAHNFLNDDEHQLVGMVSGNRWGKTTLAWVKMMVTFGFIECDPKWEIFTEHGVKYWPWTGPKEFAVISYNWDNHRKTIWPRIIKDWTPPDILSKYQNWYIPQKCDGVTINADNGGSIHLMACSQPQGVFESAAWDGSLWDEQGVEQKFIGAEARVKTRRKIMVDENGYEHVSRGAHVFGLTPHKMPDRPDTGAGTWIHRMYTGEEKRGLTVKFFHGDLIKDVPDWIYAERQKVADLEGLDEAIALHNKKAERRIRSRLYGEWEQTGGLVYDEFDDDVHVINDFKPPANWCAIRAGDHGRVNPTAFVCIYITPENDYVVGWEYTGSDLVISQNVKKIVEASGNELVEMDPKLTPNQIIKRFEEKQSNERYLYDVLDGRSFKRPDDNSTFTLGSFYQMAGMTKIRAAPIEETAPGIAYIKELMTIRPKVMHIQTKELGAPRLYFMRGCVRLIRNLKAYRNKATTNEDGNPSEKPQEKNDHDLDALRYGLISRPRWNPTRTIGTPRRVNEAVISKGYWVPEDGPRSGQADKPRRRFDKFTGQPL